MAEILVRPMETKEHPQELIRVSCKSGVNLLQTLLDAGIFVDNACSGKGICGKCKVKVLKGSLSEASETEKKVLKEEELADGIRLSCLAEVTGDVEIALLQKERKHKVLTDGYIPEFQRDVYESGYGVAIDIGTTTVVTALIDLQTGKEIANASMINAQKHFGLDVLTRITYEYENPETGVRELQEAIVKSINAMLGEVCQEAGVNRRDIREIDVAANCTMMHMFLGVDARSIGRAPYKPEFLSAQTLPAKEIGIEAGEDTILYCLPQVSAYIGADIVAGRTYVKCKMQKEMCYLLILEQMEKLYWQVRENFYVVPVRQDQHWKE